MKTPPKFRIGLSARPGLRLALPAKPWLECAGELAHLHRETTRIQKIIEEEFEQIEPDDRA